MTGYRDYIQRSRGEFTVARDQYVRPRTGWFSDRSACYLAAGRPVITQETGFGKFMPTGDGLFAFTTMDDVLAAVDAIESDYDATLPRRARDCRGVLRRRDGRRQPDDARGALSSPMARVAIVAGYLVGNPVGGHVLSILHWLAGLRSSRVRRRLRRAPRLAGRVLESRCTKTLSDDPSMASTS